MDTQQVRKFPEPTYAYAIESFCGDGSTIKKAMDKATEQASSHLDELYKDYREIETEFKVVSTATQAFATEEYFHYTITLTIEFTEKKGIING